MSDYQRICLVHYHEIGLKGHNRKAFEERLLKNLEALLSPFPVVTIHRISGRLCVFFKEDRPRGSRHHRARAGRCARVERVQMRTRYRPDDRGGHRRHG